MLVTLMVSECCYCDDYYNQGLIEPPKAVRGHACNVDGEILHVTKNNASTHTREYESLNRKWIDSKEYRPLQAGAENDMIVQQLIYKHSLGMPSKHRKTSIPEPLATKIVLK